MNAREYLKGLNEHDPVWDTAEEYEYTEDQLINFAERYHEKQLKLLRIGVVSKCTCKIPDPRVKNSENGISGYCVKCVKPL